MRLGSAQVALELSLQSVVDLPGVKSETVKKGGLT